MDHLIKLFSLFDSFPCIITCFQGILIPKWRPTSLCTTMNSTAFFSFTAGDLQGCPLRVLAPHRALFIIGPVFLLCVMFICVFLLIIYLSHNGLSARCNIYMFNGHFLITVTTMLTKCLNLIHI